MLKKPDLIVMDFDGTIVNSHLTLARISKDILAGLGLSPPLEEIRDLIGLSTEERFRRHGVQDEFLARAVDEFAHAHAASDYSDVEPIAGLEAWLSHFHDTPKWILSSAPERPIRSALERLRLSQHFDRLICRTSGAPFHKTAMLRGAVTATTITAHTLWSFGDELSDLTAGIYVGAVLFLIHGPHNRSYRFLADFSLEDYTCFDRLGARTTTDGFCDGYLAEVKRGLDTIDHAQARALAAAICETAAAGRTIYLAGNGGCHAIAAHFAADVRRAAVVAGARMMVYLLGNSAETVSALSNDLGFRGGLWNEASAALAPGDLMVLLSTSGSSINLVEAARQAEQRGARVFGVYPQTVLTGGALAIAQLNEDVLSAFCHLSSFSLRRSLLWNAVKQG